VAAVSVTVPATEEDARKGTEKNFSKQKLFIGVLRK
jgi:hypothetical protein